MKGRPDDRERPAKCADLRDLGRHLSIFVRRSEDPAKIVSLGLAFSHLHRGFVQRKPHLAAP
ncbi:MAG: hypothetical protein CMN13_00160 [Roseobacter sp.]|nr:hypothetical protein [Roseobacter sp.]